MALYPTVNDELRQAISEYRSFMGSQRRHWIVTGCVAVIIFIVVAVASDTGLIIGSILGLACAVVFVALMGIVSLATLMADGAAVEGYLLYARSRRSRQRQSRIRGEHLVRCDLTGVFALVSRFRDITRQD